VLAVAQQHARAGSRAARRRARDRDPVLHAALLAGAARDPAAFKVVEYFAVVVYDIVVANVQVAAIILGPLSRVQPAFIRVPLDLQTDFAVTVLASTVTLTPGTVSVEIEPDGGDGRVLVVHALRCLDEAAMVAEIKTRYERRLKEILEC